MFSGLFDRLANNFSGFDSWFGDSGKLDKENWKKQEQEEEQEQLRLPEDYPPEAFEEGKRYHISLIPYLTRYCKQDEEIKEEFLYEIRFFRGREYPKNLNWGGDSIYCDGYYTFALVRRLKSDFSFPRWFDSVIALISFNISKPKRSLKIVQIQGVKGKRQFLKPLRWEHLLVNIVVDWAKANGFKRVEIQRAEDNKWYQYAYAENQEKLKIRYNVTAERYGFIYDKKRRVYSLSLKKTVV